MEEYISEECPWAFSTFSLVTLIAAILQCLFYSPVLHWNIQALWVTALLLIIQWKQDGNLYFKGQNEKSLWIAVFLCCLRPVQNSWYICIRKLTKNITGREEKRFLAVWGRDEHRLCESQSLEFSFKVDVSLVLASYGS